MYLLNFSHPLTQAQLVAVETISGHPVEQVCQVKTQFDQGQGFAEQLRMLMQSLPLKPEEWQTQRIVVNPPSLSVIAVLVLAELHGRMGYFPAVLRLRPIPDSMPPQFEVTEILNLQAVRDSARTQR
ncbi:MAG TPA: CRISPR-associated protein Csx15 [Acidobacteriota bacterium]|nr:CRISPR-associated protein Csx15 [Acidobacteriota bacterium]HNG96617.1 CRISPR-associated protein Csx15 [Acidobacteriota bacterium]